MRLTSIYNKASFQVEMLNSGGAIIPFDGVQPKVDSTGRANDSFRRVESRIEFVDPNFPVPEGLPQLPGQMPPGSHGEGLLDVQANTSPAFPPVPQQVEQGMTGIETPTTTDNLA
jgi:hypothetical protein